MARACSSWARFESVALRRGASGGDTVRSQLLKKSGDDVLLQVVAVDGVPRALGASELRPGVAAEECVRGVARPASHAAAALAAEDEPGEQGRVRPTSAVLAAVVEFGLKSLVRLQVDERFVRLDGDSVFIGHDPGCDDAEDSTTAVDLLGSSGDVLADEDR